MATDNRSAAIARVQRDGARSSVVVSDRILAVFQGEYANAVDFANGYILGRCAAEDALAEAERVLRVISGWNTDRVDAATAIAPAASYFATKDLNAKLEVESNSAAIRESRYTVNPAERLRELLHVDEIPETAELTYSFSGGYERLTYRSQPDHGGLEFQGSYHPEGVCVGPHICSFCGRTLLDGD